MAELYVIAGHGAGDPGAGGNGYGEAERVRALASRIRELGGDAVELHDFADNAYASGALNWVDVGGAQVVELHMDSGPAGARGGHVIYCGRLEPDGYDRALASEVASIFPGRANSLVGRTDLANPNRAANRGIGYRLVENGFITSAGDVETFNSRMDDLARAYLRAFGIEAHDAPSAAPGEPAAPSGGVAEDGWWGTDTTAALQRALGTVEDGEVWGQVEGNAQGACTSGWVYDYPEHDGSPVIRELQSRIGMVGKDVDGILGPATVACLQKRMGTVSDGELWGPSPCVAEMQRRLNAGTFPGEE